MEEDGVSAVFEDALCDRVRVPYVLYRVGWSR